MSKGEKFVSDILELPREGSRDLVVDLGMLLGNPSSRVQRKILPCAHSSRWKAVCVIGDLSEGPLELLCCRAAGIGTTIALRGAALH